MRRTVATGISRATGTWRRRFRADGSRTTRSSRSRSRLHRAPANACWWHRERIASPVSRASWTRPTSSATRRATRPGRCCSPTPLPRRSWSRPAWRCASPGSSIGATRDTGPSPTSSPGSTPSEGTCSNGRCRRPGTGSRHPHRPGRGAAARAHPLGEGGPRAAPEHRGQADVGSPLAEREVLPAGFRRHVGRGRGGGRLSGPRVGGGSLQRRLRHPVVRALLGLLRGAPVPALQRLLLPLHRGLHRPRARGVRGWRRRRAQARPRLPSRDDVLGARLSRRSAGPRRAGVPLPGDSRPRSEHRAVDARVAYIQGGLMSPSKKRQGDVGVAEPRTKAKPKLDRPRLYKVLLHNDDYTPMEFVVLVLREVFAKSDADATAIMLHAHTHGMAVAGVYTFEIAETKLQQTMGLAEKAGFPLLCTMEPEDAPG